MTVWSLVKGFVPKENLKTIELIGEKDRQIRKMTNEEISLIESIRITNGFWYWEPFDGYLRVFKECLRRNIEIKQKTKVDFDLERFQNIGRWIQTVYTSNKRKTLEKYNYDKLKNIPKNLT